MPMLLIEGSFRIVGAGPDGDSIRFYPNDPREWDLVEGPNRVRLTHLPEDLVFQEG